MRTRYFTRSRIEVRPCQKYFQQYTTGMSGDVVPVYLVYVDEPACDAMSRQSTLSLIPDRSG